MEILLSGPDWKFRDFVPYSATWEPVAKPEYDFSGWPNATVPGNAQIDLLRNGMIEDPYVDFKSRDAEWVSQRQWVYAKEFALGEELAGKRLTLRFDGIDYAADIHFNSERLGRSECLSIPVEFDVTDKVKLGEENSLVVVIDPAPDEYAQIGWTSRVRTFKPRMPYGWDFAVRCIPLGIWQDVKLIVTGGTRITDCWAHAALSDDLKRGTVNVVTSLDSDTSRDVVIESRIVCGKEAVDLESTRLSVNAGTGEASQVFAVPSPSLWWPNGAGKHDLYQAQVTVKDASTDELLDEKTVAFGFKRVRLLPNIGIPEGLHPWNFEVNGVRTFIKGWNWVPIDHLYGGNYAEKYERLIRLAAEANVNLLRVWGGGIIEKEVFYELCDRHGIMVWQEFTLSSSGVDSHAPTGPDYLAALRRLAETVVPLRRNHASLAVWCGGNELVWTGEEDAAMSVMREVCSRLDPEKVYIPTSPLFKEGQDKPVARDVHGGWQYHGVTAHYKTYNDWSPAFHSEFGCEGAANFDNVERFIKDAKLWPPNLKNPIYRHRGAWWVMETQMRATFGETEGAEQHFRLSQFLQWEGLRYIVESNRRRKWACGGTIPWQFNEPWPNLTCTNAVDYYGDPKPAYYAVAAAYEPVHVSARYDSLAVPPGSRFSAGIFGSNSGEPVTGCVFDWSARDLGTTVLAQGREPVELPGNSAVGLGSVEFDVPQEFAGVFMLILKLTDHAGTVVSRNVYFFSSAPEPIFESFKSLPPSEIKVLGSNAASAGESSKLVIEIANSGESAAMFVCAAARDNRSSAFFKHNCLVLAPGDRGTIEALLTKPVSGFVVQGWNTNAEAVP